MRDYGLFTLDELIDQLINIRNVMQNGNEVVYVDSNDGEYQNPVRRVYVPDDCAYVVIKDTDM